MTDPQHTHRYLLRWRPGEPEPRRYWGQCKCGSALGLRYFVRGLHEDIERLQQREAALMLCITRAFQAAQQHDLQSVEDALLDAVEEPGP